MPPAIFFGTETLFKQNKKDCSVIGVKVVSIGGICLLFKMV